MNNAQIWARTMLGDGKRIHGYLGHYLSAPPANAHYERLQIFLGNALNNNFTIIDAWKGAHNTLTARTNWGMLYNSANQWDTMKKFTADSPNGSNCIIYYVAADRLPAGIGFKSGRANSGTTEMEPLPLQGTLRHRPLDSNKKDFLSRALLTGTTTSLEFEKNGRITYHNDNLDIGLPNIGYALSDEEAVAIAEQHLDDLGLLPQEEYRAVVSIDKRQKLSLDGSKFIQPEIIGYHVRIFRTHNGIDIISDEDDMITVSINKNGLSDINYLWRDLVVDTKANRSQSKTITCGKAETIYKNNYGKLFSEAKCNEGDLVTTQAYMQWKGKMKRVWIVSQDDDYLNMVVIDMETGDILQ